MDIKNLLKELFNDSTKSQDHYIAFYPNELMIDGQYNLIKMQNKLNELLKKE